MQTDMEETVSRERESVLRLKRPLVPIDEYAARQGLSRGLVEDFAKLGILQIRKHKGKMFVLNVPLNQSTSTTRAADIPGHLTDQNNTDEGILEQAEALSPEVLEIARELTMAVDEIAEVQKSPGTADAPDSDEAFEITAGRSKLIDKSVRVTDKPESNRINLNRQIQRDLLTAQIKVRRAWQIAAMLSIAFLFVVFFAYLSVYKDRQIQLDKLLQAQADIRAAHNNSEQANRTISVLQNELAASKAQIEHIRREFDNYKMQEQNLRNELAQAKSDLKTMQQRNAEAAQRLNRQIQKLSEQSAQPIP